MRPVGAALRQPEIGQLMICVCRKEVQMARRRPGMSRLCGLRVVFLAATGARCSQGR